MTKLREHVHEETFPIDPPTRMVLTDHRYHARGGPLPFEGIRRLIARGSP